MDRTGLPLRTVVTTVGLTVAAILGTLAGLGVVASLTDATWAVGPALLLGTTLVAASGAVVALTHRRRAAGLCLLTATVGGGVATGLMQLAATVTDAQGPGLEGGAVLALLWTLVWCAAALGTLVPPPARGAVDDPT